MPTQFYVSGPAYIWTGLGPQNAFLFLGYSESGITVGLTSYQEDVNVDYAGLMPGTVTYLGEDATVGGTLTRYDEQVMQKVVSWKGPNGIAGQGANNVIGSLIYEEGLSYPLLLYSPYSFKTQYGSMVPGFLFPNAYHAEPNRRTLSVRRTAPEIGFKCVPVFGTFNGSVFQPTIAPFNGYELYSNIMPSPMPLPT